MVNLSLIRKKMKSRCKITVYCENRHRREDRERHNKECNISLEENTPASNNVAIDMSELSMATKKVPYKMVQVKGKGRGLVATRTLELGDLVFSERAFLKISSESKSFCHLDTKVKEKLMNLSCPEDARLEKFEANKILKMKFEANHIVVMHGGEKTGDSAVFEMMSMINHSCIPNVAWFSDNEDNTRKEVRVFFF